MKIHPLNDYIVVQEVAGPSKVGSLIIPASVKSENFKRGKVIAVGVGGISPSGERVAPLVVPGDVVIFEKSMGLKVAFPGAEFVILGEGSILAKIDE